jgi:hypothetical protein
MKGSMFQKTVRTTVRGETFSILHAPLRGDAIFFIFPGKNRKFTIA